MTYMEALDTVFEDIATSFADLVKLVKEAVEKLVDTLTLAVREYVYGNSRVAEMNKKGVWHRIKLWLRRIFRRGKSNHHYMEAFNRRNYR